MGGVLFIEGGTGQAMEAAGRWRGALLRQHLGGKANLAKPHLPEQVRLPISARVFLLWASCKSCPGCQSSMPV